METTPQRKPPLIRPRFENAHCYMRSVYFLLFYFHTSSSVLPQELALWSENEIEAVKPIHSWPLDSGWGTCPCTLSVGRHLFWELLLTDNAISYPVWFSLYRRLFLWCAQTFIAKVIFCLLNVSPCCFIWLCSHALLFVRDLCVCVYMCACVTSLPSLLNNHTLTLLSPPPAWCCPCQTCFLNLLLLWMFFQVACSRYSEHLSHIKCCLLCAYMYIPICVSQWSLKPSDHHWKPSVYV